METPQLNYRDLSDGQLADICRNIAVELKRRMLLPGPSVLRVQEMSFAIQGLRSATGLLEDL